MNNKNLMTELRELEADCIYREQTLLAVRVAGIIYRHEHDKPQDKPTVPASLVEVKPHNVLSDRDGYHFKLRYDSEEYGKFYYSSSCYSPQESLAELAGRKGYWININQHNGLCHIGGSLKSIVGFPKDKSDFFEEAHTYSEAESSAREYLNGLPDKGESK